MFSSQTPFSNFISLQKNYFFKLGIELSFSNPQAEFGLLALDKDCYTQFKPVFMKLYEDIFGSVREKKKSKQKIRSKNRLQKKIVKIIKILSFF